MRIQFLLIIVSCAFSLILGCGGIDTNGDDPEKKIDEEVIKIFSSKDLKDFLSQVFTKDRSEFAYYIEELKKDSVNKVTREKLVEILQNPDNNEYYIATMLYLMASSEISEALPLIKNMMYHPDAYIKFRCISAFTMLADRSERNLLLPLVSNNEKFEKVREQATNAFYAMITAEDFDNLFNLIKNPTSKLKTDTDRKNFIVSAIKFCLEKQLDDETRKNKEISMISLIGNTSIIAEEFILAYFKGRLTTKAFKILVELYCDYGKSRTIHVLTFGEIHRFIKTKKEELNFGEINENFVNTLINDIIYNDKHNDIHPADIDYILQNFDISEENQKQLEDFINSLDLVKNSSVTLKYALKILLNKGKFNEAVEKIIANSKDNENLVEINLEALSRFIDEGFKKDSIAAILSEFMFNTDNEKIAKYCAKQLADINSEDAISHMLEGLKHEKRIITDASAYGLTILKDKSYFTEIIREKELINKILRNEEMEEHNIISTLKVLGNMGSSAVDANWIEQYCPYKNQSEVKDAIDAAVLEIETRERNGK